MSSIKVESVYPITTTVYPEGIEITTILMRHLEEYTLPIKFPSLMKQLEGQTMTIDGVYPSDVERWLNGEKNND